MAGYTIKEAVALARSMVPGQRAYAFHLIASVFDRLIHNIYQNQLGCILRSQDRDRFNDWEAIWAFTLGPESELALLLRRLKGEKEQKFRLSLGHVSERKEFLAMCLVGKFEKRVTSPDPVSDWVDKGWKVNQWIKVSSLGESIFLFRFPCETEAVRVLTERERWMGDNFLRLHRLSEEVVLECHRRREGIEVRPRKKFLRLPIGMVQGELKIWKRKGGRNPSLSAPVKLLAGKAAPANCSLKETGWVRVGMFPTGVWGDIPTVTARNHRGSVNSASSFSKGLVGWGVPENQFAKCVSSQGWKGESQIAFGSIEGSCYEVGRAGNSEFVPDSPQDELLGSRKVARDSGRVIKSVFGIASGRNNSKEAHLGNMRNFLKENCSNSSN
ncbi:hypothetical protein K7X08_008647 [Anisodus acutangulus]|uniref:DUF4283 domain-containing protein n=1 Tax=Anisodus acutangulus TaxID=402998 RepID=A0A9Q1RTB2_9SOLA|nr:hypothetical protein K7X08_008647 [Anisodus acutangulus]